MNTTLRKRLAILAVATFFPVWNKHPLWGRVGLPDATFYGILTRALLS